MDNSFREKKQLFQMNLQGLSDEAVVQKLARLLEHERKVIDAIMLVLKEVKVRRLYAAMGYSSLFEMLVKHFKLGEHASYQRLQALKLMETVNGVEEDFLSGNITLSNMALVQSFIQREEKLRIERTLNISQDNKSLDSAVNLGELQLIDPTGAISPSREIVATDPRVQVSAVALSETEKFELIHLVKGKTHRQAQEELTKLSPLAMIPRSKVKPLTVNLNHVSLILDTETVKLLEKIKSLMGHEVPDGQLSSVIKRIAERALPVLERKKHRGEISQGLLSSKTSKGRYLSGSLRREIFRRAENQCQFVGSGGRRCESQFQLEIDHIRPVSQGGSCEPSNLQVLCRTHNQYRLKQTHGKFFVKN